MLKSYNLVISEMLSLSVRKNPWQYAQEMRLGRREGADGNEKCSDIYFRSGSKQFLNCSINPEIEIRLVS
jgi:hypothetical protein